MKTIKLSIRVFLTLVCVITLTFWAKQGIAQTSPPAGTYLLQNVATGLYMSIEEADQQDDLVNVIQKTKTADDYQRFDIEITKNGYRILPVIAARTKYLSVIEGIATDRNKNGTQLIIADDNEAVQTWKVSNTGTGALDAFTIQSTDPSSKNLIGVNNGTDTKVVQLSNSVADKKVQWRFVPVLTVGQYYVQNVSTGLYLNTVGAGKGNGTKIEQTDLQEIPSQAFQVVELGDNEGYAISPLNTKGKRWLSVNAGSTSNPVGTPLFIYQAITYKNPTDNQFWTITAVSGLPSERGQFTIRSQYASSNKFIGVNSATDKQVVQVAGTTSTALSRWRFVALDEPIAYIEPGRYVLQNVATGKVMDVYGARTANGTKVIQYDGTGEGRNEQFQVEEDGDYFRLSPSHTYRSKCLSVEAKSATSNKDGTPLFINDKVLNNTQTWDINFEKKSDGDELYFSIKSTLSGKCLGLIDTTKADIVQMPFVKNDESQLWIFTEAVADPDKLEEGRYIIQNANSGKVLDVSGALQTDGAAVVQNAMSGGDNQAFEVIETGPTTYKISPIHTQGSKFLSVYGGTDPNRNSNGKTLYQAGSNPLLQNWEITRLDVENVNPDDEEQKYSIRSTDPSSDKLLGIYNPTDKRVVQWSAEDTDTRFQWNFVFDDYINSKSDAIAIVEKNARKAAINASNNVINDHAPQANPEVLLSVAVSPNPVLGDFEVQFNGFPAEDNLKVRIVNVQGQPVYQTNTGIERHLKLNTKALQMNAGMYIIEVNNDINKQTAKIIVIN